MEIESKILVIFKKYLFFILIFSLFEFKILDDIPGIKVNETNKLRNMDTDIAIAISLNN